MVHIRVIDIINESFQDYKKPSMLIATCYCDWKCARDGNFDKSICQNSTLNQQYIIDISIKDIIKKYINNPITKSIVFGGLEPFLQFEEIIEFLDEFRKINNDDIVIYTGYYLNEIKSEINILKKFSNIIIKFGRYIPNRSEIYDETLGVYLSSDNQYAIRLKLGENYE